MTKRTRQTTTRGKGRRIATPPATGPNVPSVSRPPAPASPPRPREVMQYLPSASAARNAPLPQLSPAAERSEHSRENTVRSDGTFGAGASGATGGRYKAISNLPHRTVENISRSGKAPQHNRDVGADEITPVRRTAPTQKRTLSKHLGGSTQKFAKTKRIRPATAATQGAATPASDGIPDDMTAGQAELQQINRNLMPSLDETFHQARDEVEGSRPSPIHSASNSGVRSSALTRHLQTMSRDSQKGVIAAMNRELKSFMETILSRMSKLESNMEERLDKIEQGREKMENSLNVLLFSTVSKARSGKERERQMMNELLKPIDIIFAGSLFESIYTRIVTTCAIDLYRSTCGLSSDGVALNGDTDGETQSNMLRAGMTILETLFFSRQPNEAKTQQKMNSLAARSHFLFRRKLTKSMLWYAANRPEKALTSLRDKYPVSVRGTLEEIEVPYWLKPNFLKREYVNSVLDEFEKPSMPRKEVKGSASKSNPDSSQSGLLSNINVAKEAVRRIYKTETQWLNKSRDAARKSIFDSLFYLFDDTVMATVNLLGTETDNTLKLDSIPSAAVTYNPHDDAKEVVSNNKTWAELCLKCDSMLYTAEYDVTVSEGPTERKRKIRRPISILNVAAEFLAAFCRNDSYVAYLASSTNTFAACHMIAVVLNMITIRYTGNFDSDSIPYLTTEDEDRLTALHDILEFESEADRRRIIKDRTKLTLTEFNSLHRPSLVLDESGGADEGVADEGILIADEDVVDMTDLIG